jgi:hypothetical protein
MATTAALEVASSIPVGIGAPRAEVAAALDRAAGGAAQLVLVSGPSGVGKTGLCGAAAADAAARGFRTAGGRCWAGSGAPPLWPWPAVLRELNGDHGLRRLGDAERFTLFRRIADAVDGATRRPCLLTLDDVHLADAGALLLARFLVHALEHRPLVVMLSRRTDLADGDPNDLMFAELAGDATCIDLRRPDLPDRGPVTALLPAATKSVLAHAAVLGQATIWEIAALVGVEPVAVLDALASPASAGAVEISTAGVVSFGHEEVRTAARAALTRGEQLDAHARAVELRLGGGGRDAAARAVTHAVAAAPRSTADRTVAVEVCRDAARAMRAGGGYERAAELLDTALTLADGLLTGDSLVSLQLQRADAALACGRLDESRRWFGTAADGATDAVLAARAALGVGGVWVYEHRDEYERDRVRGQQRAALARLPLEERALRAGLRLRLAAEAAYDGAPVDDVLAALEEVRAASDDRAIAQGLSLTHHVLLAPEHLAQRRALADELVDVASTAGDGLLVLFGLMWRTVDRYHAGDPSADRSLAELGERAAAVGCRSIQFIVEAMGVMRLVRAGRLDAAEVAAGQCFELGVEVGDADAVPYYGAHLLTIRWYQGRDHEIVDLVTETASSPTLMQCECSLRAAAAGVAARAGRLPEAAAMLHAVTGRGLDAIPRSSTWLAAMVAVVDAAHALGEADVAREAHGMLAPFADLPVVPSLAVTCLGSVERSLGLAAATYGDLDGAITHLERAVAANRTLGNRPAVAVTRADLADALARRDAPGDRARAVELLGRAVDEATDCAMPVRAAAWAARRDELDVAPCAGVGPIASAAFERGDAGWDLVVAGRRAPLPVLVGVDHLVRLVEHPGRVLTAIELSGADAALDGGGYDVLDRATVDALRRRVAAIDDEIARARRRGKLDRVALLETERCQLEDEMRRGLGRGGRSRRFATPGERARTSVTKALKRAVAAVAAIDAPLGAHLADSLVTGTRCCYRPPADSPLRCVVGRTSSAGGDLGAVPARRPSGRRT